MTAHDADTGALTDRYRDLVEVGRGGETVRYSGRLLDGSHVTVWVVARPLSSRIVAPERFLATLGATAEIRHAGLAPLVSFGRAGEDVLHCAYATSPEPRHIRGPLPASDIAIVGAQLARSLAVLHDSGILHGAIAPDRLTQTGVATMEGVGLHAAFVAGGLTRREAAVALSPAPYLSSELQAGGEPDERSDIYSLGASLYELLTGKPPFGGRTTSSVMATVLATAETPVPGITAAADQPDPVVEAILRAIEHAPEDRWGTAGAFANALESGRPRPSSEVKSSSWGAILKRAWFPARRSRE